MAPVFAQTNNPSKIRPETLVRFPDSTIACVTPEALGKAATHFVKGETTKGNAMFDRKNPDAQCVMLATNRNYRVIAAEYNNADAPDVGILEVVGEKVNRATGGWVFTFGAVVVKPK